MNSCCPSSFEESHPWCIICGQPVALETSKANENGEAVHEECYVEAIILSGQADDVIPITRPIPRRHPQDRDTPMVFAVPHDSLHMHRWSADAAAVLILMIITWFTYRGDGPATALRRPSTFEEPQAASITAKAQPVKSVFRQIRVSGNEIDDVAEDVTIRHFRAGPETQSARVEYSVVKLGDDVTMRYFAPDPHSIARLAHSEN
jgi:hypothetical protein